ncbi:phosphatase 2C-like domain-containing protein [Scenedesmus sp. NREL 46B-D3]|nr:phosphatase 2C-like domain-containing protein [Scenedesmus sp. NREL 46B-D3]
MDAFQAGEEQEHDACSLSDSSSSTAPALSVMREHRGSKSSGGVQLSQQDSLLHPPLPVARTRSQPGGHSSGIAGGPAGAAASSPPQRPPVTAAIERTSTATLDANGGVDHGVGMHDPGCTCPPYAVKSTCGKRPNMEDTYALVGSLSSSEGGSVEKLHFFGVYDGHGGIEASQHCAQRLHYHLSKAVAELASGGDCEVDSNEGSSAEGSEGTATSFCGLMEEVLRDAFLKTDEEFSNSGLQAGLVGSTAVVALVGTHRVWIANCGDSRAVLSRAGVAVQVTDDHKPEREDEAERVEKAGGQVLYWNGHRVMGVLAMSRAIGDHCLRPYVIPEPEISVFARHPRDEILLLASDGLWDVLSNQDATDLALRSIKRAREKGASRKAAARVAATVLTKAAVDRGSRDNITVVIIDLAPAPAGSEQQRPCGDKAALAATAAGIAPQLSDSGGEQQQTTCGPGADADGAAAAASGSGSRPSSSGSSKGAARTGSVKGSGSGSNPFAAAAASPFSTAATGSSELPLPSGASGSASAAGNEALAAAGTATAAAGQAPDRSVRSSAGSGRLRGAGTSCALGGSSSASTATAVGASAGMGASGTGGSMQQPEAQQQTQRQGFVELMSNELDSIDLSGMGAAAPRRRSRLTSIDSMAKGSSAAEGSTTSSSLEEQPTIVEPPPALVPPALVRQASSSPFSAFQGSIPFSDGGAETVC